MASAGRRRLGTAERRAEFIAAGIELFSEHGASELSAEQIARAAGGSKALLFHYFGNKRGYFLAVVREIAERVEEATRMDPRLPAMLNLRLLVDSFVTFVRDDPAIYQLLRGDLGGDDGVRSIAQQTRLVEVERVLEVLGLADASPKLRTAIHGWIGFVEASTLTWVEHRGFPEEELVEMSMQAIEPILTSTRTSP